MKKKRLLLFVLIFFLLLLFLFLMWFFNWRNAGDTSNTSSTAKGPYLELTVTESPSKIDTICQRVEFTIKAKNTGDASLKYSDIENGNFGFTFAKSDTRTVIADTGDSIDDVHNLYVEDFGEIKGGQTKELTFYTKETYVGGADFGYQNGFNMLQSYGNGSSTYYFEFERNNGGNSYTMLSNVPEVSIDMQAFEYSGTMWSNKICN